MSCAIRNEVKVPLDQKRAEWNEKLRNWGCRQIVWAPHEKQKYLREELTEAIHATQNAAQAFCFSYIHRGYRNAALDKFDSLKFGASAAPLQPLELDEVTLFDEDDSKELDDEEVATEADQQEYVLFGHLEEAPQAKHEHPLRKPLITTLLLYKALDVFNPAEAVLELRKVRNGLAGNAPGSPMGMVASKLNQLLSNLNDEPSLLGVMRKNLESEIEEMAATYAEIDAGIADCETPEAMLAYLQTES